MHDRQAVNAILFGAALVAIGLIPGLLARLMHGIQNFRDHWFPFSPASFQPPPHTGEMVPAQSFLALAGAASMLIGVLALIAN